MNIPAGADHIGSYRGFELFYVFNAEAVFSARAMAYLFARSKQQRDYGFTQVAAVRRDVTSELTTEEIERRLAVDVISRAKIRIEDRSFDAGQAYTMELDGRSMEKAR